MNCYLVSSEDILHARSSATSSSSSAVPPHWGYGQTISVSGGQLRTTQDALNPLECRKQHRAIIYVATKTFPSLGSPRLEETIGQLTMEKIRRGRSTTFLISENITLRAENRGGMCCNLCADISGYRIPINLVLTPGTFSIWLLVVRQSPTRRCLRFFGATMAGLAHTFCIVKKTNPILMSIVMHTANHVNFTGQ